MKKIAAIVCTALMTLSLAACSATVSTKDFTGKTIEGQVKSVNGSDVTVQLGEVDGSTLKMGNEAAEFVLDNPTVTVQDASGSKEGSISDVTQDSAVSFKVGKDKKVSDVTVRKDVDSTMTDMSKSYDGK